MERPQTAIRCLEQLLGRLKCLATGLDVFRAFKPLMSEQTLMLEGLLFNPLWWQIYVINSVNKTKLPCYTLPLMGEYTTQLYLHLFSAIQTHNFSCTLLHENALVYNQSDLHYFFMYIITNSRNTESFRK